MDRTNPKVAADVFKGLYSGAGERLAAARFLAASIRAAHSGTTTVTWDTSNSAGAAVRSGMYYVKLGFERGVRLATVPIVR